MAASLQHVSAAIVQLLLEAGADIHAAISAGNRLGQATAVQLAAAHGCAEQLVALIAAGADFQAPGAADCTALSFAACNRHEPCVRILLEQGAQVMATDGRALPLDSACQPACLLGVQSRAQESEPFALALDSGRSMKMKPTAWAIVRSTLPLHIGSRT